MFTLNGKYNNCKVFADTVDNATISQIINVLNQESSKDSQIRIMPDCHAAKASVVGTTMTIKDKIIPNLVGADLGCGVSAVKIKGKVEFEKLDKFIRFEIPSGGSINKHAVEKFDELKNLVCPVNIEQAYLYIGSLGGGENDCHRYR